MRSAKNFLALSAPGVYRVECARAVCRRRTLRIYTAPMKNALRNCLACFTLALLAACGNKGPLVLPDTPAPAAAPAAGSPADVPAAEPPAAGDAGQSAAAR